MTGANTAIVGVGPVGGILAAYLLRSGVAVTAIDVLAEHLAAIQRGGLAIEGAAPIAVPVSKLYPSLDAARAAGEKFDLVFLCVKAAVNKEVVGLLPRVLSASGLAVSFQNGLDTEAGLVATLGPDKALRGVVNYAGNLLGPGRIRLTFFNPPNYLGAAVPGNQAAESGARQIAGLLTSANLETKFSGDIRRQVWEKVIRNGALMPISALTGMDMAQVMESATGRQLVEKLLSEAMAVSAAAGFAFDQQYYDDTLAYLRKAGHHVPSMLADVRAGRRTENEFLNHQIAEYGERTGVPAPYNRAVADLLRCIDELAALRR